MESNNKTADKENQLHWLNRTVGGTGLTSALGDFCYETGLAILPGFFAVLGLPAALLGVIEGAADAVASFTKMAAGFIADKLGNRKALVLIGYALTPLGQAMLALTTGWPLLLTGRLVSWFGKGLRGPLRDVIVTQAVRKETRGRAFGFHRAMDTLGAVVGPLLAVSFLGSLQTRPWEDPTGPFRLIFWLTTIPGLLSVLSFMILVKDPGQAPNPSLKFLTALRELPFRFKAYLRAVGLFGAGDFSHTLLILAATNLLAPSMGTLRAAQAAGMLYVLRNATQALVSYPVGSIADRFGVRNVLIIGYLLGTCTALMTVAAFLLPAGNLPLLAALFLVAGIYMAVQETLETVVAADMLGAERLGSGYGALGTVNGATKFISSSMVGILWTGVSPAFAFALAGLLMAAGAVDLARSKG